MGMLFDIVDRMHGLTASGLSGAFLLLSLGLPRLGGVALLNFVPACLSLGRCDERLVVGQIEIMKC